MMPTAVGLPPTTITSAFVAAAIPLGTVVDAASNFVAATRQGDVYSGDRDAAISGFVAVFSQAGLSLKYDPKGPSVTIGGKDEEGEQIEDIYAVDQFVSLMSAVISGRLDAMTSGTEWPRDVATREGLSDGRYLNDYFFTAADWGLVDAASGMKFCSAFWRDTDWRRFTHPKERDVRWSTAGPLDAGRMLAGAAIGTIQYPIGNTAAGTIRLPRATAKTFRAVWDSERIGPNLKAVTFGVLPFVAVATPPLILSASVVWGLLGGGYRGVQYGVKGVIGLGCDDTSEIWRMGREEGLSSFLKPLTRPLPEGEEPFDIRPVQIATGLLGAMAATPVQAIAIGALNVFPRSWQIAGRVLKRMWTADSEDRLSLWLRVPASVLTIAAVPASWAVVPIAGAMWGMADGARIGYTKGFAEALDTAGDNVEKAWDLTGEFLG